MVFRCLKSISKIQIPQKDVKTGKETKSGSLQESLQIEDVGFWKGQRAVYGSPSPSCASSSFALRRDPPRLSALPPRPSPGNLLLRLNV